ncbi:ceramide synthase 1-like, partial [Tropilaelaps mercedesae]
ALTRLYYYPFKAIYATSGILLNTANMAVLESCSVLMIFMLYAILIMDLYWFGIITAILYKSLRGTLKNGVDDIREEDVADKEVKGNEKED